VDRAVSLPVRRPDKLVRIIVTLVGSSLLREWKLIVEGLVAIVAGTGMCVVAMLDRGWWVSPW
jgi:hypothetical protein